MRYISAAVFALLVAASVNAAPFGSNAHDKALNDMNQAGRRSTRSYSYAPAQVQSNVQQSAPVQPSAPATSDSSAARRSSRSYSYQPVQRNNYEGNVSTGHLRADAKPAGRF